MLFATHRQPPLFHEGVREHVADDVVRVFDAAHVRFRDVDIQLRALAELSAVRPVSASVRQPIDFA